MRETDGERRARTRAPPFPLPTLPAPSLPADGSALFLTVARYLTPDHHAIDGVGIPPDAACAPGGGGGALPPPLAAAFPDSDDALRRTLGDDPCVQAAERLLVAKLRGTEA